MTARPAWPPGPAEGYSDDRYAREREPSDQALPDHTLHHAGIGEMARLLRETRGSMLTDGGVLAAIAIGTALESGSSARALRPNMLGVINIGLLCGLFLCWLTAVTLLALAGRPVLNAVSEFRWKTGSPLDPRAWWLTLPPPGTNLEEWTLIRAHILVGAARLSRYRIQLADTWTCVTGACFLAWTAVIILGL